jgi:hypothetical protein
VPGTQNRQLLINPLTSINMREYNYDKYMINCSYVQIRRENNDNKGDQTEHSDMHKLRSRGIVQASAAEQGGCGGIGGGCCFVCRSPCPAALPGGFIRTVLHGLDNSRL